jgi:predicted alpha/beta superfamily hydrolase
VVEAIRRALAVATSRDAIVVGIGYPDCGHYVFGNRRAYDLTPPCENYVPPKSWDGRVFTLPHGGADVLLNFIETRVRGRVLDLFTGFIPDREILAGHSYGGLCVMHALFTHGKCFDTFISISPTIWWSDHFLLSEEKRFLLETPSNGQMKAPSLYLSYGHYEQYPRRRKVYSDEEHAKRLAHAISLKTKDDIDGMAARLHRSGRFELVKVKEYMDDDHGSVAGCALGWAICDVLDPDRFA